MDKNNIDNVWLPEIFKDVESTAALRYRAIGVTIPVSQDAFIPTEADYDQLIKYAISGAARIVSKSDMIQDSSQTPLDAINYTTEGDFDLDDDDAIGRDDFVQAEKMPRRGMDQITFAIDGLSDAEMNRYTLIQQSIRECLGNYILHRWFGDIGLPGESALYLKQYEEWLVNLSHNSVRNNKRKGRQRPTGHFLQ